MLEYAIMGMKPLQQTKPEHVERDKKFSCFVRYDLDAIFDPKNRIIVYLMAPLLLPRWVICWGAWMVMAVICWVVGLFHT